MLLLEFLVISMLALFPSMVLNSPSFYHFLTSILFPDIWIFPLSASYCLKFTSQLVTLDPHSVKWCKIKDLSVLSLLSITSFAQNYSLLQCLLSSSNVFSKLIVFTFGQENTVIRKQNCHFLLVNIIHSSFLHYYSIVLVLCCLDTYTHTIHISQGDITWISLY